MDSAGTEHDLVRMVHSPSRRCPDSDADHSLPLKRDPIDESIAEDCKVLPVAGRL
jgi:hypothetical protein